jgi:hypothetical protein
MKNNLEGINHGHSEDQAASSHEAIPVVSNLVNTDVHDLSAFEDWWVVQDAWRSSLVIRLHHLEEDIVEIRVT